VKFGLRQPEAADFNNSSEWVRKDAVGVGMEQLGGLILTLHVEIERGIELF
jgi:tartrate dehydratase alpha subunit/fumarate hydratase class I-like protein